MSSSMAPRRQGRTGTSINLAGDAGQQQDDDEAPAPAPAPAYHAVDSDDSRAYRALSSASDSMSKSDDYNPWSRNPRNPDSGLSKSNPYEDDHSFDSLFKDNAKDEAAAASGSYHRRSWASNDNDGDIPKVLADSQKPKDVHKVSSWEDSFSHHDYSDSFHSMMNDISSPLPSQQAARQPSVYEPWRPSKDATPSMPSEGDYQSEYMRIMDSYPPRQLWQKAEHHQLHKVKSHVKARSAYVQAARKNKMIESKLISVDLHRSERKVRKGKHPHKQHIK